MVQIIPVDVPVGDYVKDLHVNGNRLTVKSDKQLSFSTVSNKTHLSYWSFYISMVQNKYENENECAESEPLIYYFSKFGIY